VVRNQVTLATFACDNTSQLRGEQPSQRQESLSACYQIIYAVSRAGKYRPVQDSGVFEAKERTTFAGRETWQFKNYAHPVSALTSVAALNVAKLSYVAAIPRQVGRRGVWVLGCDSRHCSEA